MMHWHSFAAAFRSERRWAVLAALMASALAVADPAPLPQQDPELRAVVQQAINEAQCFADKYDSAVWFTLMEPKLRRYVKDKDERLLILHTVFCESHRPGATLLPPGLVMAVLDVESGFDHWAVSSAGAVGLMQVMPFWPRQLGVQNQLVKVAPNIRMGCEILRYYLRVEHHNWTLALARYNGSVGRNKYPALVMQRWERAWRF